MMSSKPTTARSGFAWAAAAVLAMVVAAGTAQAATGAPPPPEAAMPDSGDSALVLVATIVMLAGGVPGLALLHAGRARAGNGLTAAIEAAAMAAIAVILFVAVGYSLAFSTGGNGWLGGLDGAMFGNLLTVREGQTVGELVFALFQLALAAIAAVMVGGAWIGRARFGWVAAFAGFWTLVVYVPVTRWTAGGGWLSAAGVIDTGQGIAMQVSAGVSALIIAQLMGRRDGWSRRRGVEGAPELLLLGTAGWWVAALARAGAAPLQASDIAAATAIVDTILAGAAGLLTALAVARFREGRSDTVAMASGLIAALAAIMPGAGAIGPIGAMVTGAAGAASAMAMATVIRTRLQIDDVAAVFANQAVATAVGALLVAPLSMEAMGGIGYDPGANPVSQLGAQALAIGAVTLWSAIATVIGSAMVGMVVPMRVTPERELAGLDARVVPVD